MGQEPVPWALLLTVSEKQSEPPAQESGGPRAKSQACPSHQPLNLSSIHHGVRQDLSPTSRFLDDGRSSINGSYPGEKGRTSVAQTFPAGRASGLQGTDRVCSAIHLRGGGQTRAGVLLKAGAEAGHKPQHSLKSPALSHPSVLAVTLNKALLP